MNNYSPAPSRDFVAIDVEYVMTDGHRHLCQCGIAIVRDLKVTGTKTWNIQPPFNIYDDHTSRIHQMTPEDTADSPTLPDIWPEIAAYIEGQELWAHNAKSAEIPVINGDLDFYGIAHEPIFINDSRDIYRRPDCTCNGGNTLQLCCIALGIDFDNSNYHSAVYDAEKCADIVIAYAEGKIPAWEDTPASAEELRKSSQKKVILHMGEFQKWQAKIQKEKSQETSDGEYMHIDLFAEISSTRPGAEPQIVDVFDTGDTIPADGRECVDYTRLDTSITNLLKEQKIAITGVFNIGRKEIVKALQAMGAKSTSSISKNTAAVLIGTKNVALSKLAAIEKLYNNGYQVARIVGNEDLYTLLYSDGLCFGIGDGRIKQLDLTWAQVQEALWSLPFPRNTLRDKELYLPAVPGDRRLLAQAIGNIGAYANDELDEDTHIIILPPPTIDSLRQGEKDELIQEVEQHYNSLAARTFELRFIALDSILSFLDEWVISFPDAATAQLLTAYRDSASGAM